MNPIFASDLLEQLSNLEDPRDSRAKRHELGNVVFMAICAVLGGADCWTDVEVFCNSKRQWFESLLDIPDGIPSHDTFGRVFSMLDPEQFQRCFTHWIAAISEITQGNVVAIDGKALRGSADDTAGVRPTHLVSAWAQSNSMILGQLKVADHSNEITAIPQLLETLDVSGSTVTIDAMGCQKKVVEKIIEQKADYVLALKENQPRLYGDVAEMFANARKTNFADIKHDSFETVGAGHGRIETRRCWVVWDPDYVGYVNEDGAWVNLTSVAMVESERLIDGNTSKEVRYYISSLPGEAERMLASVRGHWGIENSVHWVLDVTFGEDNCRVRKGNAAENFSTLRRMAMNMLRRETTLKASMRGKRKRAGWDEDYLLKVLRAS